MPLTSPTPLHLLQHSSQQPLRLLDGTHSPTWDATPMQGTHHLQATPSISSNLVQPTCRSNFIRMVPGRVLSRRQRRPHSNTRVPNCSRWSDQPTAGTGLWRVLHRQVEQPPGGAFEREQESTLGHKSKSSEQHPFHGSHLSLKRLLWKNDSATTVHNTPIHLFLTLISFLSLSSMLLRLIPILIFILALCPSL